MRARLTPLVALAALVVILPATIAAGGIPDPTTPLAVAAIKSGNATLVEWTPGAQAPDYYAVYGIPAEGARSLLATVGGSDDPQARVPTGFASYSVSAFTGTTESPSMANATLDLPCVYFDPGPPPKGIVGCIDGVGGHVQFEAMLPR